MTRARGLLAAVAVLLVFADPAFPQRKGRSKLPKIVRSIFLPADPNLIRYQPDVYEKRFLRVMDQFEAETEPNLLSKTAIKEGYDPAVYYIFQTSHQTSEMRCYVERKDTRNLDIAKNLVKDEKIALYGELAWVQRSGAGRVLHFKVDQIERGWDIKPVMTIELSCDKFPNRLYRIWESKEYTLVYPPAKTKDEEEKNSFIIDVSFKTGLDEKPKAGAGDAKTYVPVDSDKIPYQPKAYVGRNLLVKDSFDELLSPKQFSKEAERLGYRPATHLLFRTPATGSGADLYCYLRKDDTFYADLVEALVKNVKITLYGTFIAYDDASVLRMKHFEVDRVDIGWEEKPTVEIRFGTQKVKPTKGIRLYRPYVYLVGFPPWSQTKTYDFQLKCYY